MIAPDDQLSESSSRVQEEDDLLRAPIDAENGTPRTLTRVGDGILRSGSPELQRAYAVMFTVLKAPICQYATLGLWLGTTFLGLLYMMPYFGIVGWQADALLGDGLPSKAAMEKLHEYFPLAGFFCDVGIIKLQCLKGSAGCPQSVLGPVSQQMVAAAQQAAADYDWQFTVFDSYYNSSVVSHFPGMTDSLKHVLDVADHTGRGLLTEVAKHRYVSPDNQSMLLTCCHPYPEPIISMRIDQALEKHNTDPRTWLTGVTSFARLSDESVQGVLRDLPIIDAVAVPSAFAIMAYMLRSARFLSIAFLNLIVVVFTTFFVLYAICTSAHVTPDPTQINFVTVIALGLNFDYSLFLLTRFVASYKAAASRHARAAAAEAADIGSGGAGARFGSQGNLVVANLVKSAVSDMLYSVAPVILSSGFTLVMMFSGFLFLSSPNLRMAGMGCAVTAALCVLVSLTAVPAALLLFPTHFAAPPSSEHASSGDLAARDSQPVRRPGSTSYAAFHLENQPGEADAWYHLSPEQAQSLGKSWFASVTRIITRWPMNAIVLGTMYVWTLFLCAPVIGIRLNNDVSQVAPRGGGAWQALQELVHLTSDFAEQPPASAVGLKGYAGFAGYVDEFTVILEATHRSPDALKDGPVTTGGDAQSRGKAAVLLRECGYAATSDVAARLLALETHSVGFHLSPTGIFAPGYARGENVSHARAAYWMREAKAMMNRSGYDVDKLLTQRVVNGSARSDSEMNIPDIGKMLEKVAPHVATNGSNVSHALGGELSGLTSALRSGDDVGGGHEVRVAGGYTIDTLRRCGGDCFKIGKEADDGSPTAATLLSVLLPVNPGGYDAARFVTAAAKTFRDYTSKRHACSDNGLSLHLHIADAMGNVIGHDMLSQTHSEFTKMLPVVCLLVFVMIGVFLKSALVPLRLLLTLFLPLAAVFGTAVLVFQHGWLGWLGWPSVAASSDTSFHWEVPLFCFALTIALALDYDLFVVMRVADYRFAGFSPRASIVRAMHETGPVVTGAGLMMAIAFGGNLLAESETLNQAGWIMASGVLVDTFVVRSLLLPALLSVVDTAMWWPSVPPQKHLLDEHGMPVDPL